LGREIASTCQARGEGRQMQLSGTDLNGLDSLL